MAKRTAAGTLALAVCLGGGSLALAGAAHADSSFSFGTRVSGTDRYDTAIQSAKAAFPTGSDNVILVNGHRTVDGLTASYLAGVKNAPILYTDTDTVPTSTWKAIGDLKVKNVFIVGGTAAVSADQVSWIKGQGLATTQIGGKTRYETSQMVAAEGDHKSGKAFIASGIEGHTADALVIGAEAFKLHIPIILTGDGDTPVDGVTKELKDFTLTPILVGGTGVITAKQAVAIGASESTRLFGANRAQTAIKVAEWSWDNGFDKTSVALTGSQDRNAADALSSSPYLGSKSVPVLYAGSGDTTTYLAAKASQLTGKGYVVGGTASVSASDVTAATTAAQSVAAAVNFTVTDVTNAATGKFVYSNPDTKKAVTASFASTDKFLIDGTAASSGAFAGAVTIGDLVSLNKDSSGVTTFTLTSKDRTKDFMAGVIANANTTGTTFDIIEPVTGVALNSTAFNYTSDYTFFTIDGVAATAAQFALDINDGDSVAITGGDGTTAAKARTIALTNRTVAGAVAADPTAATKLSIKSAAGAVIGDALSTGTGDEFTLASGDSITYNGSALTAANFDSSHGITAGDTVTYSRKGGVQTVVVADAAPAAITGTVASGATASSLTYWLDGNSAAETGVNVSTYVLSVNGSLVSSTEFASALAAGGQIVIQKPGASVTGSAMLTTKPLSGRVSAVSGTNLTVRTASDTGNLATVDYSSASSVFSSDATAKWVVNGTTVTQAQFASEVSYVANGTKTATLTASDSASVVTYSLATVANTASAKLASTSTGFASGAGRTTVTVKFDKPVYLSATAAATDFTFTGAGLGAVQYTDADVKVAASASNTIVLSIPSTTTTAASLTVALTATGAAKFLDASGKAATASSTVITVS